MVGSIGIQPEAPFFHLLPVDVQHHILQHWIARHDHDERGLLRLLSAMDIACCSHECREQAIIVMGRVTFDFDLETLRDRSRRFFQAINHISYWEWLTSRNIRANALLFPGEYPSVWSTSHHLPTMRHVSIEGPFALPHLENLLASCPNITSVFVGWNAIHSNELLRAGLLWMAMKLTNFRKLFIAMSDEIATLRCEWMPSVLHALPETMEEVYIPLIRKLETSIFVTWASRLSNLKVLEMWYGEQFVTSDAFLQFVHTCEALQHMLFWCDDRVTTSSLENVLRVGRHLLSLKVRFHPEANNHLNMQTFVTLLERHTWLDALRVGDCAFRRSTRCLDLELADSLTVEVLGRLLKCCTGATKLFIDASCTRHDMSTMMTMIGEALGASLLDVTVTHQLLSHTLTRDTLLDFARSCPNVTSLDLFSYAIEEDVVVELVAICPKLVSFKSNCSGMWSSDKERALVRVLNACGLCLKRLHLKALVLSAESLEVILSRGLRIQDLHCGRVSVAAEDEMEEFRESAVALKLVPVMCVTHEPPRVW